MPIFFTILIKTCTYSKKACRHSDSAKSKVHHRQSSYFSLHEFGLVQWRGARFLQKLPSYISASHHNLATPEFPSVFPPYNAIKLLITVKNYQRQNRMINTIVSCNLGSLAKLSSIYLNKFSLLIGKSQSNTSYLTIVFEKSNFPVHKPILNGIKWEQNSVTWAVSKTKLDRIKKL